MKTKLVIIIVTFFALGGLLAACRPQNAAPAAAEVPPSPVPTSTPTVEPTGTPLPAAAPSTGAVEGEIRPLVVRAVHALYSKTNRMETSVALKDGQTKTTTIEFIPPNRMHILSGGTEYIVVGEQVYTRTGEQGSWSETKIPAVTFLGNIGISEEMIDHMIEDVQLLRQDTHEGQPVKVYSYRNITTSGDFEMEVQTELWVKETDGLPCKMVMDGGITSVSDNPETGETKVQAVEAHTTVLVEFDETIQIEPPVQ